MCTTSHNIGRKRVKITLTSVMSFKLSSTNPSAPNSSALANFFPISSASWCTALAFSATSADRTSWVSRRRCLASSVRRSQSLMKACKCSMACKKFRRKLALKLKGSRRRWWKHSVFVFVWYFNYLLHIIFILKELITEREHSKEKERTYYVYNYFLKLKRGSAAKPRRKRW